jgi:hypothetical protein
MSVGQTYSFSLRDHEETEVREMINSHEKKSEVYSNVNSLAYQLPIRGRGYTLALSKIVVVIIIYTGFNLTQGSSGPFELNCPDLASGAIRSSLLDGGTTLFGTPCTYLQF